MDKKELEEFLDYVEKHNMRDYNLSEAVFFFLDAKIKEGILKDSNNNQNEKENWSLGESPRLFPPQGGEEDKERIVKVQQLWQWGGFNNSSGKDRRVKANHGLLFLLYRRLRKKTKVLIL